MANEPLLTFPMRGCITFKHQHLTLFVGDDATRLETTMRAQFEGAGFKVIPVWITERKEEEGKA